MHAIKGRFRLEHAQIMTVPDIKRAAELGGMCSLLGITLWARSSCAVIGSYQPTHATSDVSLVSQSRQFGGVNLKADQQMWYAEDRLVCSRHPPVRSQPESS